MSVPDAAITAAAEVLTRMKHAWLPADEADKAADRATVTKLLEAAAPHITAAERERACRIAASYLDGNVLREFCDEIGPPPREDTP